ncbi:MAG: methyltransferase domain-containing protein [Clostridia bacterium]
MPTPPSPFPWVRLRPLVPSTARWLYLRTIATQAARAPRIEVPRMEAHTRWCDLDVGLDTLAFEGLYRYPQALCTGLDPDMLSLLAGAAGVSGLQGRLTLVEEHAKHPALTGPFDLVTARVLLQHAANPRRVNRSAARLPAAGGGFRSSTVMTAPPSPTPIPPRKAAR